MAYEITRLSNRSTLILTLSGEFDTRTILRAVADALADASAPVMEDDLASVCCLVDARHTDRATPDELLRLLEALRRTAVPNNTRRTNLFVVASHQTLEIIRYAGMPIGLFETLEDAVACANTEYSIREVQNSSMRVA